MAVPSVEKHLKHTPFALSLSKGWLFFLEPWLKEKTMLRRAQHERERRSSVGVHLSKARRLRDTARWGAKMKKYLPILCLAGLAYPLAAPLAAQDPAASENSIVVTAQRSGAPMWTIDTPTGTIILVGEIRAIPKTTPWQPDRLKDATAQASRVILGARPKISPGDVLRLMFSGRKFTKLPDKTVASEYLTPAQWARLEDARDSA